jgi:hypothetical protein
MGEKHYESTASWAVMGIAMKNPTKMEVGLVVVFIVSVVALGVWDAQKSRAEQEIKQFDVTPVVKEPSQTVAATQPSVEPAPAPAATLVYPDSLAVNSCKELRDEVARHAATTKFWAMTMPELAIVSEQSATCAEDADYISKQYFEASVELANKIATRRLIDYFEAHDLLKAWFNEEIQQGRKPYMDFGNLMAYLNRHPMLKKQFITEDTVKAQGYRRQSAN